MYIRQNENSNNFQLSRPKVLLSQLRKQHPAKYVQLFLSALALIGMGSFAVWWFNASHVANNFTGWGVILDVILFGLVSYVIWQPLIMEVLTWGISSHIKDIRWRKPAAGLKVAFITTIVPKNEPVELLHKCLPAMVRADYPHDTWLLDEGNSEEAKKICALYGVKHFSRHGFAEFNTQTGKYTKTKGGNHNSWYDSYGNNYDYVAQIDTDFVPKSNFLIKTLGYFRDPKVAFVGTPQIYGNTESSLVALGASQQQLSFYGVVLKGLSGMGMTLLIGANHVIRVSAFKQVGHYTAHITEDLVTGMKLHAHGWKSVYAPFALAIGEGPTTWESYFNQQLRWAYGCIDILFRYSPKYFRKMGLRQALYYFFLQQHYFSGLAMALSVVLLSLYFIFGIRAADVDVFKFLIFYSGVMLVSWLMSVWLQRYDIYRKKEGQMQMAGKVISIAAWPVWFLAFLNILTGKRLVYKVTPKGEDESRVPISIATFLPHFIFAEIALTGLLSSFFTHRQSPMMLFWAASSALVMVTIPFSHDIVRVISKAASKFSIWTERHFLHSVTWNTAGFERGSIALPYIKFIQAKEKLHDSLFLTLIVLISLIGYINKLGFYSDDWSFLGNFALSKNQSLIALFEVATTPNTFMRPMQNFYDAFLYWLFGTAPLGYHIVNGMVFGALIIVLYLIMRLLKIPRIIAVSGPLVFALLPNYSTDRFWYAAFQVNLMMLLFLFSTYAGLRALLPNAKKTYLWKTLSILSLVISAFSYEVILPLVLLNIILFWNPAEKFLRKKFQETSSIKHHIVFIVVNLFTLLHLLIFKAKTTTRLGEFNYPGDIVRLVMSVTHTNFIELGVKLPIIWGKIIVYYFDPAILIVGFILYIIIFVYLFLTFSNPKIKLPGRLFMTNFTIVGLIIFGLGYAIFFANNKVGFSPTGIDNRVAIAASVGFAFVIVGIFGWISTFLPRLFAKWLFCVLVALICTGGFITINSLAPFWSSAYGKGQVVLSDIQYRFPVMPKNSTLILDGVCPYSGPGIVFESQWDLMGALQTIYKDETIKADIVTPRLLVTNDGLATQIYTFPAQYPYQNLYIYNFKNKMVYPIANREMAENYFKKFNPDHNNNCPPAHAGNGVTIF